MLGDYLPARPCGHQADRGGGLSGRLTTEAAHMLSGVLIGTSPRATTRGWQVAQVCVEFGRCLVPVGRVLRDRFVDALG
jgi:hypothetical protein